MLINHIYAYILRLDIENDVLNLLLFLTEAVLCGSQYCASNAECIVGSNGPLCACKPGYTGYGNVACFGTNVCYIN